MLLSMGGLSAKGECEQAETQFLPAEVAPGGGCRPHWATCDPAALTWGRLWGWRVPAPLSVSEQVQVEGQGLAASREAESVQASCGWPTLSGCSKAAPALQHGSGFAIKSDTRNNQTPEGAVLQSHSQLCLYAAPLLAGAEPWVCALHWGPVEELSQKEFGTFWADIVALKLAAGALGHCLELLRGWWCPFPGCSQILWHW